MIDLGNRTINDFGLVVLKEEGLIEQFYTNGSIEGLQFDLPEALDAYDKFSSQFNTNWPKLEGNQIPSETPSEYHINRSKQWNIPEEYLGIDLDNWFAERITTEEQAIRIRMELDAYARNNATILLKLMIYLVDTMRANNIVWGVGRGSSVASYCLYIIGIHKIDSLRYQLDLKEFLK